MQCGCPLCGTLSVQAQKGLDSMCVCPACGWQCQDCMGKGGGRFQPISREMAAAMKRTRETQAEK